MGFIFLECIHNEYEVEGPCSPHVAFLLPSWHTDWNSRMTSIGNRRRSWVSKWLEVSGVWAANLVKWKPYCLKIPPASGPFPNRTRATFKLKNVALGSCHFKPAALCNFISENRFPCFRCLISFYKLGVLVVSVLNRFRQIDAISGLILYAAVLFGAYQDLLLPYVRDVSTFCHALKFDTYLGFRQIH